MPSAPRAFVLVACLAACGGGPSEDDVVRSEAQFNLGRQLAEERDVAGAFQHLLEAVRLNPGFTEAHLVLGTLYLQRGDFAESEHHLLEALRTGEGSGRPDLASATNNSLGVLYIHTHRYDDAIRVLRTAATDLMNREPYNAWGNLGWAYYEEHEYDQALDALGHAVQLQPRFCNGWYRMGQVHFARGESGAADGFTQADQALSRVLETDHPACQALQDAWLLRGETRARLGRREEAVSDLERCVELSAETESGRACARFLEAHP